MPKTSDPAELGSGDRFALDKSARSGNIHGRHGCDVVVSVQSKRTLKVEKLARIYDDEIAPVWGTRFGKMLLRNLAVPDRGQVLDA